jgi:hypothetical protein
VLRCRGARLELGVQRLAVADARRHVDEARILLQLWTSQRAADAAKQPVVGRSDEDLAVGAVEELVGRHHRHRRTHLAR